MIVVKGGQRPSCLLDLHALAILRYGKVFVAVSPPEQFILNKSNEKVNKNETNQNEKSKNQFY